MNSAALQLVLNSCLADFHSFVVDTPDVHFLFSKYSSTHVRHQSEPAAISMTAAVWLKPADT